MLPSCGNGEALQSAETPTRCSFLGPVTRCLAGSAALQHRLPLEYTNRSRTATELRLTLTSTEWLRRASSADTANSQPKYQTRDWKRARTVLPHKTYQRRTYHEVLDPLMSTQKNEIAVWC